MGSPDFKMALATSSKIAGRNLVKSWIPLVAQHRCYNGDNLQERNRKPNTAPNFVKIGLPKWWHETAPDIQFRKGFWKYIFQCPSIMVTKIQEVITLDTEEELFLKRI